MFAFYSFLIEQLEEELLNKKVNKNRIRKKEEFIILDKEINEKSLKEMFLLSYQLKNLVYSGFFIEDINNLSYYLEEIDNIVKIRSINVKSKIKEREFLNYLFKKLKESNISIEKDSLFELKVFSSKKAIISFRDFNFSDRYYLKFFKKEGLLNPVIWQNIISFVKPKKIEKIVFLKCYLAVASIEYLYFLLDLPGSYKRKDFFLIEYFELVDEISKINEKAEKNIEKVQLKNLFCLNDNASDVDKARKVSRTISLEKNINFSRTDLFWIDWKFSEKEIDHLFSYLNDKKEIEDFFYQAEYVAKNAYLLTKLPSILSLMKNYNIRLLKKIEIKNLDFFIFSSL